MDQLTTTGLSEEWGVGSGGKKVREAGKDQENSTDSDWKIQKGVGDGVKVLVE